MGHLPDTNGDGRPNGSGGRGGSETLQERINLKNVRIHELGRDLCARGLVNRVYVRPLER